MYAQGEHGVCVSAKCCNGLHIHGAGSGGGVGGCEVGWGERGEEGWDCRAVRCGVVKCML